MHEDTGVARESQRLRRVLPHQQLRQLPHPVRGETAADALARDVAHALRLRPHLLKCLLVGIEVELRYEAQPAHEPQRVLREAVRRHRPQDAALEILATVVRVDNRPVGEVTRHRVDREVAAVEVILDGGRRVDDDLEVVPAWTCRHLAARRRELDPRPHLPPHLSVARIEPHADGPAGDDQLLGATVRLERRAQAFDVHTGDEEIGVLRLVAEQLVAHCTADDVRVQPKRADIVLYRLRRVRSPRSRPARRQEAWPPRRSTARAASSRRASSTPRSSRRSRRGSAGTRWS